MANRRRSEGFGFFVPVLGAVMIMPPIVHLFDQGGAIFGIPIIFAYLFGLWLMLVGAAFVLARLLPRDEPTEKLPKRTRKQDRDQDQGS